MASLAQMVLEAPVGWEGYTLGWVERDNCFVDASYQRDEVPAIVKLVAEAYDPDLFEPIAVNVREDGTHYAIDGQQRLAGLARRSEHDEETHELIPARIYSNLSVAEEAELYVKLNSQRREVSQWERFKARLVFGDMVAEDIRGIVRGVGKEVGQTRSADVIGAVGALEDVYMSKRSGKFPSENPKTPFRRPGREALALGLWTIVEAWPGRSDSTKGDVIRAFGQFFLGLEDDEFDLDYLVERLRETTPSALDKQAGVQMEGTRGQDTRARGIAREIVKQYNKKPADGGPPLAASDKIPLTRFPMRQK